MKLQPAYPTLEHEKAAESIVRFFTTNYSIDTVLLVNSCARGKATRDSCLDIVVLIKPESFSSQRNALETGWERFEKSDPDIQSLKTVGKYSEVHLDFSDGVFSPPGRDEAAGPDDFELWMGNYLAYSAPLWQGSDYLASLKKAWLPYYNEELRVERLSTVRNYCLGNLHHIPLYVKRGLFFQSFDRLYNAYREFLQSLFIARCIYPIAYNKWIREQVEEILGEPALYRQLTHLFEIKTFESTEIAEKAREVETLLDQYAPAVAN